MKMNNMNLMILTSPWPIITTINVINLSMNLLMELTNKMNILTLMSMMMMSMSTIMWMSNSMKEKILSGIESNYNLMPIKSMIILIISSEIMFFSSFFYINYSMKLFNNSLFNMKFNVSMFKLNLMLSFINLIILLTSSLTMMMSLKNMKKMSSLKSLSMTMILASYFLMIQLIEYNYMTFNLSNSIFMSNFYMLTMFHMSHVFMGLLMMSMLTTFKKKFINSNKTKMMALCWYWHFIDLIWLMIFLLMYL